MKTSQEIKALFEELPIQAQRELLENLLMEQELQGKVLQEATQEVITKRDKKPCPHCSSVKVYRRGKQMVETTKINIPKPPLKKDSAYKKRKKRKHFRRRATLEPIIGHLKSDYRVARNFLKGQIGDSINFMMAAAGFNYKKTQVNKLYFLVILILKVRLL